MNRLAALLVLFLLALSNVATAEDEPERLRIHGSNRLGAELVPTMVLRWLSSIDYVDIERRELGPSRTEIRASRDGQALVVEIDKSGTATGINDIIQGEAEIAMSSRRPNAQEMDNAWQLGDLTSPGQEWVVALDGLVVVVAPGNPVSELSMSQLRDVLSGKIRDWRELGGRPGAIAVHTLPTNTGTQELTSRLLSGSARSASPALRHPNYASIVAAVTANPNGIGVLGLRVPTGALRTLAISDGARAFHPDALNVRSEDYPLQRRLYLHTGQLITALGRGFVEYAISPMGQRVVERSAFVSLNLAPVRAPVAKLAPAEYQQITGGALRLPMTLHFSSGLDLFDSRARQDIERLSSLLGRPENAGRKLVLVGFANPEPKTPYQSLSLSQERVDFVASELLALNLRVVTVRGLGGKMNLMATAQPGARFRNERVEVWLR